VALDRLAALHPWDAPFDFTVICAEAERLAKK
jgi:hypothetical protein